MVTITFKINSRGRRALGIQFSQKLDKLSAHYFSLNWQWSYHCFIITWNLKLYETWNKPLTMSDTQAHLRSHNNYIAGYTWIIIRTMYDLTATSLEPIGACVLQRFQVGGKMIDNCWLGWAGRGGKKAGQQAFSFLWLRFLFLPFSFSSPFFCIPSLFFFLLSTSLALSFSRSSFRLPLKSRCGSGSAVGEHMELMW